LQSLFLVRDSGKVADPWRKDANSTGFFSVLCDGMTDTAVKAQISIVLRFVKNEEIHEVFVGFEELQMLKEFS